MFARLLLISLKSRIGTVKMSEPEKAGVLNAKAKSSYYHFGTTDPETAKAYVPQKIDPAAAANASKADGVSSWNANGTTWEDRDMTDWAKATVKQVLGASPLEGCNIELSVVSVEGEASIVYSRGKPRIGYDFTSVKCTFKGDINGDSATGEIEIVDLDESSFNDEDYEINFEACSSDKSKVRKAIKEPIHGCLSEFVALFKKQ